MKFVPKISVIVPIFNEAGNLQELHDRLKQVFENTLKVSYEILFIDDGSSDDSWTTINRLRKANKSVKGITFSRNFGHHFAITAGFDYVSGKAIVLMDGDLQDRPEEIPRLYEKYKQGYDVVYAVRQTRDDPLLKKIASALFYRSFKVLARVEVRLNTGLFRIVDRKVADSIKQCREKSRMMIALMTWTGFSHTGVETHRDARHAGTTKYSIFKLLKLAFDGITSFSYVPLRIASYAGFFFASISLVIGIYMLIKKLFFGIPILGYASIIVSILFIGGIQLFLIGIMGEYIGRIYTEAQNRPLYIIKEKIGFE